MKKLLKILGVVLIAILIIAIGVYAWASLATSRARSKVYTVHTVDFPIPFPIDPQEVASAGLTEDAAKQLAQSRAVERGDHLVHARYACVACHGQNFGGGVMVDAFPLGSLLAPNLTLGTGSRTTNYKAADWDHIVRHGVKPDGTAAVMPSEDFKEMSDQELSDVVSYIRTLPPVNNTVPTSTFGPLGKILVATGQLPLAATVLADRTAHEARPPATEASAEFGKHLAAICSGCHGADFSGGPITGGDPSWPPARNLTPDETGLKGWTFEQFETAVTKTRRPDGTALREPMTLAAPIASAMTDVERRALWAYLQSVPPVHKEIAK